MYAVLLARGLCGSPAAVIAATVSEGHRRYPGMKSFWLQVSRRQSGELGVKR